ncbi:MAG TPA: SemiSWEET transporter [Aquabacterium sp.]|uniref:SemiSWEET transporter n=1 Tax=Aquabacterium sp. TaxID=1872578 RepID=UPI002E30154F|nr:SemiSWEET transporter [Aquabacterium sp.]HEX5374024.1 SemiSWEET transporter [Aquabacterium sp.]
MNLHDLWPALAALEGLHIETIGSAAAVLTTGSFIPQAWLTFRTRNVSGISLGMYSAFTVGVALWLVYGLAKGSWPMTVANGITLALALAILGMKLRYGRAGQPPAN